ncbi:hypothetical protein R3I93_006656 [Phoxinus phoxinus]|uniref:Uncharacterized protein n=1 Tax=Phoxinus phoxinus TaxID=58324 RepID=A0AAN9D5B4_9TELE
MDEQVIAFGVALLYLRSRRRRSVWVHDILQARQQFGEYHRLVQELRLDDSRFQQYFRLDRNQFDNLLSKVGPRIERQDTNYRRAILMRLSASQFVYDSWPLETPTAP